MAVVVDDKAGEDPDYMVMADDGNGEGVGIPTFLVGMYDGVRLKEAVHREGGEWSNKVIV